MSAKSVLVTGGLGYIGSHVCAALAKKRLRVVAFDNLANSRLASLDGLKSLCGDHVKFVRGDVRDAAAVLAALKQFEITDVIHLAALKSVQESIQDSAHYYDNNVVGTFRVLEAMQQHGVNRFVFSSSACVYGDIGQDALNESSALLPTSPYGRTKVIGEQMTRDMLGPKGAAVILRYFNPLGAHSSGMLLDRPLGKPQNVMPALLRTRLDGGMFDIFGDDYPTPDGTCLRDYVHVEDLADGHVAALDLVASRSATSLFNLGTGRPTSVRELLASFVAAAGTPISARVQPRRTGDVMTAWANVDAARRELSWVASRSLPEMCASAIRADAAVRGNAPVSA